MFVHIDMHLKMCILDVAVESGNVMLSKNKAANALPWQGRAGHVSVAGIAAERTGAANAQAREGLGYMHAKQDCVA